ncbi:MAG: pyruvate dehydrogenase complex dihydrolipoamide acetyltransferase [Gemmatimonadales bacterium]|nr:pyruvate dehydrogenase complex dihydrolipoamide acetyltransferase [Gemmatimonadales bacterium]
MATKIVMEALSPTMEEGRLVEWKKNEGDPVAVGDVLAEVETDKAVMELVARGAGVLLKQAVAAGTTVPVSDLVGWIGEPGENVDGGKAAPEAPKGDKKAKPEAAAATPADAPAEEPAKDNSPKDDSPKDESAKAAPAKTAAEPVSASSAATGRVKASPLARKIAAEKGVDLARVSGSGPEGRVIKRDLDGVAASSAAAAPARSLRQADKPAGPAFVDVPLSQIRKTIAKRLVQSIGPIPTFYLTSEIDMERAADLRDQLKGAYGDAAKVSFNDLVVRATALALRAHPAVNAWWQDDHIRQWNEIHVGMAVAIPDGLITPIIRNADGKSLLEIGAEAKELAGRARARKLQPDEYTGATFSISNLGMFDIEHFTAVINPPEAGILAIGSIATIPAVVNGTIVPRKRMRITMSCDHRVIDGATGAEFLKTLKQLLENPVALVW